MAPLFNCLKHNLTFGGVKIEFLRRYLCLFFLEERQHGLIKQVGVLLTNPVVRIGENAQGSLAD
jgi:hypothetical protein